MESKDPIFNLPLDVQREIVAGILGVGDNYPMVGVLDHLLSVFRQYGEKFFFYEIIRIKNPDLYAFISRVMNLPTLGALVASITPENLHPEYLNDVPVGAEFGAG